MKKLPHLLALLLLTLLALTACTPQETVLTGEAEATVLAFSEPATDNLFAGALASDHVMFTRDFSAEMLTAVPETEFTTWKTDLDSKIGSYVSRAVADVTQQDKFYVVRYTAKFTQEENVTVRVVFDIAAPHAISGLWFDSEKLRQK